MSDELKCAECGESVASVDLLRDCYECVNVVDACPTCIEDHETNVHDESEADND